MYGTCRRWKPWSRGATANLGHLPRSRSQINESSLFGLPFGKFRPDIKMFCMQPTVTQLSPNVFKTWLWSGGTRRRFAVSKSLCNGENEWNADFLECSPLFGGSETGLQAHGEVKRQSLVICMFLIRFTFLLVPTVKRGKGSGAGEWHWLLWQARRAQVINLSYDFKCLHRSNERAAQLR